MLRSIYFCVFLLIFRVYADNSDTLNTQDDHAEEYNLYVVTLIAEETDGDHVLENFGNFLSDGTLNPKSSSDPVAIYNSETKEIRYATVCNHKFIYRFTVSSQGEIYSSYCAGYTKFVVDNGYLTYNGTTDFVIVDKLGLVNVLALPSTPLSVNERVKVRVEIGKRINPKYDQFPKCSAVDSGFTRLAICTIGYDDFMARADGGVDEPYADPDGDEYYQILACGGYCGDDDDDDDDDGNDGNDTIASSIISNDLPDTKATDSSDQSNSNDAEPTVTNESFSTETENSAFTSGGQSISTYGPSSTYPALSTSNFLSSTATKSIETSGADTGQTVSSSTVSSSSSSTTAASTESGNNGSHTRIPAGIFSVLVALFYSIAI